MVAITDLYAKITLPVHKGVTNLPILVVMHGYIQAAGHVPEIDILRLANYGFMVVVPGMRARDGASGAKDASGREIYDIIDAVEYARTTPPYSNWCSPTKAAIVGYSGGGANALACACKFPDYFNVVVSHFGMSDYGRDPVDGWWANNGGGVYTAQIELDVGDTPAIVPNNYYARDATEAIQNFSGGYMYLYHDKQDSSVPWVHSDRITDALDGAGLANYSANFSDIGDPIRWIHGYPDDNPGTLSTAEPTWTAKIKSQAVWTIPASGTVTVIGYMVTKRFTIWLNTHGTASLGIDAATTVVYNTATNTYTVTPLTAGNIDVAITQGALTGSASDISAETEIVCT